MHTLRTLLALPSTILPLLFCQLALADDTGDLLQRYDTNREAIWRRDQDAISRLAYEQPHGVRKMSNDPNEKFWPHYWDFGDDLSTFPSNASIGAPSLALHNERGRGLFRRSLFSRDASCPTNTTSCTSIGHSDSCCPTGTYCFIVPDTGNGPVGCCDNGQTCGSTIPDCDTAAGYTSCPNSSNKGCCIPGFSCAGNICVNAATQTVTPVQSTTSSTTSTVAGVTTVTVTNINSSGYTITATVTTTVTQSASSSTSSNSDSAVAPVRPNSSTSTSTSASTSTSTSTAAVDPASVSTTTVTTSTSQASLCPTGYYMCSAVYLGGCCQVDRNCDTTSCPTTASTTVIDGAATVVAPTGASSAAESCATGWYLCAASLGGNCCPSGYGCASTNCPATASGAAATNKEIASGAGGIVFAWTLLLSAGISAIFMTLL